VSGRGAGRDSQEARGSSQDLPPKGHPLKPISGASLLSGPAEIRLLANIGSYVPARGGLNPPVVLHP